MKFEITELRSRTVWSLYRMRDRVQLNAQSPNDGYAIKFRLKILLRDVFKKKISIDDL